MLRHLVCQHEVQFQPFFAGALGDHAGKVVEHRVEDERHFLDRHPAGFDLGEIEDVVDQLQQHVARCAQVLHMRCLPRIQFGLVQQMGKADDGVERRADFVAHVGQKLRLHARGGFGVGLGFLQCHLRLLLVGDVLQCLDGADDLTVGIADGRGGKEQPAPKQREIVLRFKGAGND